MKKWISVLLALVLLLCLAACGKKNKGSETDVPKDQAETGMQEPASTEMNEADTGSNEKSDPDDAGKNDTENGTDDDHPGNDTDTDESGSNSSETAENTQQPEQDDDREDKNDSEDTDSGEGFTGLETSEEGIVEIGDNQGVGGF